MTGTELGREIVPTRREDNQKLVLRKNFKTGKVKENIT